MPSKTFVILIQSSFRVAKTHKNHIVEIPESLTFEQAAAIPEVWLTAFQLLVSLAHIKKDDIVLVHAAASGVGTSLI